MDGQTFVAQPNDKHKGQVCVLCKMCVVCVCVCGLCGMCGVCVCDVCCVGCVWCIWCVCGASEPFLRLIGPGDGVPPVFVSG